MNSRMFSSPGGIVGFCDSLFIPDLREMTAVSVTGRRLRERREALGLSQEKIGAAIGPDESSACTRISRYEFGVHDPPLATVKLLALALKGPVPYLYCDDEC